VSREGHRLGSPVKSRVRPPKPGVYRTSYGTRRSTGRPCARRPHGGSSVAAARHLGAGDEPRQRPVRRGPYTDAACTALVHTQVVNSENVTVISKLKRFKPSGAQS